MSLHLLKKIHAYHGLERFFFSGYVHPQIARIPKASGYEIGPVDNGLRQ